MYIDYINLALDSAKYHETKVFSLAIEGAEGYDVILLSHARAYFWELWSVWDYILQNVNAQTLNLDPFSVRRTFIKKLSDEMSNYKYIGLLKKYEDSKELVDIQLARDYAHKWYFDTNLIIAHIGEKPQSIEDVKGVAFISKDKKLGSQVHIDRSDFEFIKNMVNDFFEERFFN